MRQCILLSLLILFGAGVWAKPKKPKPASTTPVSSTVIVFDKKGKIENGSAPASVYSTGSAAGLDTKNISVPASTFINSISALSGKINKLVSSTGLPDCVCSPISVTALAGIAAVAGSLTTGQVLEYDATNPYLPIKVVNNPSPVVTANGAPVTATTGPAGTTTATFYSLTYSASGKPIDYQIVMPKPDNQILAAHLGATATFYKGLSPASTLLLDPLQKAYAQHATRIDALLLRDSLKVSVCISCSAATLTFQPEVVDELALLYPFIQQTTGLYNKVLCDNRDWINRWLWYTGGNIRLNPFVVTDPAPLIRQVDNQILVAEKRLTVLQTYMACCANGELDYKTASLKADTLVGDLSALKSRKEMLSGLVKPWQQWLSARSVASKVLYAGTIMGSDADKINWQHQYDAADKFNFITPAKELPNMVAEADQVIVLVHNVKAGDSLSLKATDTLFTPKTNLEIGLEPITAAFKTALAVASPIGSLVGFAAGLIPKVATTAKVGLALNTVTDTQKKADAFVAVMQQSINKLAPDRQSVMAERIKERKINIRKFIEDLRFDDRQDKISNLKIALFGLNNKSLLDSLDELLNVDKPTFVKLLYRKFAVKDQDDYIDLVTEFNASKPQLSWLLSQTTPVLAFDLESDDTPAYRTVVDYPEKKLELTSSKKVTYQLFLNAAKEAEVKRSYIKYTLSRWVPTVGIVYVPGNRTGAVFNDSTHAFTAGDDFDNFEALVGVKYYLRKSNPARDRATTNLIDRLDPAANKSRGNTFRSTLFLTGGFGVRHKLLRNYYLGIGGDITPGLSWQVGGNFIFQKRYELENGLIKNEYERPKPFLYFGLSIDTGIVTNLINIFK